jgi:sugar phosphate isomerase/epimerase
MFSLRLPPFTPPRAEREDRKVLLEALAELGERAAREGVWLALEPINRLDFAAALGALRTVGYDGWLALECRLRGDPEEALPATSRFLAPFL